MPRPLAALSALATVCLLAACGGGGGDADATAQSGDCTVDAQKDWLAGYMNEWYFWNQQTPRPAPQLFASVAAFFDARLYTGGDPAFPADRWSGRQSTESYERFFGEGRTLGYGVSVAGIEVSGRPGQPLWVRHVEAQSPAAAAGVQRGDEVLALNGRAASALIADNDFAALTPAAAGEVLALQLRDANGLVRSLILTAAVHTLTPVSGDAVRTSPAGRRLGYVFVKDMLGQATAPMQAAFTRLRSGGAEAVVLDLRYNGGGLVSVGATLASYLAGTRGQGQLYANLLYNERRAASNNTRFDFEAQPQAVQADRVYVLTGPRTCSASEQLINGLRGIGIEVVTIGATSCGKPVGFLPTARCGTTYSVVNFESVNARGRGRYFDGFAASCPVDEDFRQPLGDTRDPLLATALWHADTGSCLVSSPGVAAAATAPAARAAARVLRDGGAAPGMLGR